MPDTVFKLADLSKGEIELFEKAAAAPDSKVTITKDSVMVREPEPQQTAIVPPPITAEVQARLEQPFVGAAPAVEVKEVEEDKKDAKEASEQPKLEISKIDVEDYVRCVLGNTSFKKTYSLFGDAAAVTFVERTASQDEDVMLCTHRLAGMIKEDLQQFLRTQGKYRLAYSLLDLTIGGKKTEFARPTPGVMADVGDGKTIAQVDFRVSEIMGLKSNLLAGIFSAFNQFEALLFELASRANDPKFWKTPPAVS